MTGEDTDGKAAQFRRRSDQALAGIVGGFDKNHAGTADDRTPEPRRTSQNTKRDDGATLTIPRIVVAEQWLCFLLGLICLICGVCGLFMKYNQDSLFAFLPWLGPAYGPTLRFIAVACLVLGAVLVRLGLARPDRISISRARKVLRSARARRVPDPNAVPVQQTSLDKGEIERKNQHERRSG
jgi:hypothetical protein